MGPVRGWIVIAAEASILRRALATSLVVGSVLSLINHGSEILGGQLGAGHVWPIILTFVIPFLVAMTSSVAATKRSRGTGLPRCTP